MILDRDDSYWDSRRSRLCSHNSSTWQQMQHGVFAWTSALTWRPAFEIRRRSKCSSQLVEFVGFDSDIHILRMFVTIYVVQVRNAVRQAFAMIILVSCPLENCLFQLPIQRRFGNSHASGECRYPATVKKKTATSYPIYLLRHSYRKTSYPTLVLENVHICSYNRRLRTLPFLHWDSSPLQKLTIRKRHNGRHNDKI